MENKVHNHKTAALTYSLSAHWLTKINVHQYRNNRKYCYQPLTGTLSCHVIHNGKVNNDYVQQFNSGNVYNDHLLASLTVHIAAQSNT